MTRLVERPLPASSGALSVIAPAGAEAVAVRDVTGNPLADGWELPDASLAPDVVAWSGSLADDLDASHPHNWLGPGRAALDERCSHLAGSLAARGGRLLLRPHRRHVLSDAPSCARFLDDHAGAPLGLALDPVDLFEASMLEAAEDHLQRILERLGGCCSMLFVTSLLADDPNRPVPVERIHELIAELVDPAVPIVGAP